MNVLRLMLVALVSLALIGCEKKPETSAAPAPPQQPAAQITVFAAASTTDVLREIARSYESTHNARVTFSFESSSTLARQIKAGSPAEIFVSADIKWMDDVAAAKAIKPESRENLLTNRLVLITPKAKPLTVTMAKDFDFAKALPASGKLAVGDPAHVPAGRYAKQGLEWLGWWKVVEGRLIAAQDVRAALRLVEMGEADAGIVYATDTKASDKVVIAATFPEESHDKVVYPIALCTDAKPAAAEFLAYLRSPDAAAVFEKAGFTMLPKDSKP